MSGQTSHRLSSCYGDRPHWGAFGEKMLMFKRKSIKIEKLNDEETIKVRIFGKEKELVFFLRVTIELMRMANLRIRTSL